MNTNTEKQTQQQECTYQMNTAAGAPSAAAAAVFVVDGMVIKRTAVKY